jgi:hypothetical protein
MVLPSICAFVRLLLLSFTGEVTGEATSSAQDPVDFEGPGVVDAAAGEKAVDAAFNGALIRSDKEPEDPALKPSLAILNRR